MKKLTVTETFTGRKVRCEVNSEVAPPDGLQRGVVELVVADNALGWHHY